MTEAKNGLLPIVLPKEIIQQISEQKNNLITVNLALKIIRISSLEIPFVIDEYRRDYLLKGLDEIAETLIYEKEIAAFEKKQKIKQPWLYSGDSDA